jgi:hypothetical protein
VDETIAIDAPPSSPKTQREILVGHIMVTLKALEIDESLTYDELSARVGRPRHGPKGWEFALIEALELLEELQDDGHGRFFLRCGSRIGILRISANDAAAEGLSRRRRQIVRKAKRGLRQARNIAQDPDLTAEYKAYLGAQAASLGVVASAGRKFSGLGTGAERPKITEGNSPDWDGLKALYEE